VARPLLVSLAALLFSTPALASDCVVSAGPRDRIRRGETVVVEAGEVAGEGDGPRRGRRPGNLILESGAKVTGTAAAFGGQIRLSPGAKISGHRLELSDSLRLPVLSIAGQDVSNLLVARLVEKAHSCRIESGSGEIRL